MFIQTANVGKVLFQLGILAACWLYPLASLQAGKPASLGQKGFAEKQEKTDWSKANLKKVFAEAFAKDTAKDIPILAPTLPKSAKQAAFPKRKCGSCKLITPSMIDDTGIVITRPGEYCLSCNTVFTPMGPGLAAIVIDSDDVVLNLNDRSLSQGNTTPDTIGILINGHRNVTIKNGTVHSFTKLGIRGNSGVDQLAITKVNANNNGLPAANDLDMGGLLLVHASNIQITNSNFVENYLDGIAIGNCTDFWMDACSCNGTLPCKVPAFEGLPICNGAALLDFAPPLLGQTTNIRITNSTFNNLGDNTTFFATGLNIGTFDPTQIFSNILMENCEASNIAVSDTLSASVLGFVVFGIQNATLRGCIVNGIFNPNPNANHAHGIETDGSNVLVEDCSVFNVVGQGFLSTGFNSETFFGPNTSVVYRNCVTSHIHGTGPASRATGFGALVGNGPAIGVSPFAGVGYIFDSCVAEDVTDSFTQGAGFYLGSMQKLEVKNCSSNSNDIGFLMEDVPSSPASNKGLFLYNVAEGNTAYGFKDTTSAQYSYIANIARSNGPAGSNYAGSGISLGTPIRLWVMPGVPAPTNNNGILDSQVDNLDIR